MTLLAPPAARRNVVAAGVAVDLADAVAGVLAARHRQVTTATGAFLTAPALGAVAAGIAGWRA